ncbi:MAG: LysM peptidoglycan-binding domain-containing protein [Gammaproteobacteria bacterium]|jgi:nucleoid-associated protein YgaU|nr:LysM peptidoglycan-binding domain-containing protein [Gammaproteobacteria bacterium]
MNISNTPKFRNIVPFFLLSGLLTITIGLTTSCSSSETRPAAIDEPVEPVAIAEEVEAPKKEIRVKAQHPRQYTVKKGDTLWGISSMFLEDPWYWPEIWQKNQQVQNPHLIFPGDVLTLVYVDGQPQMLVNEAKHKAVQQKSEDGGLPVKKLSPGIRTSPLEASIPSIPGDAIRQFLTKPRVVSKETLDTAPYIVGSEDGNLILGSGNRVYIRGEIDKERVRYSVFRPGKALKDPETNETLGYEAIYTGEVRITAYDDPASADLTYTEREVLIGDRILPEDRSKLENLYFPHVPDKEVTAQIMELNEALTGVAQLQVVTINKGERDGMEVGHLLATFTNGDTVRDRHNKRSSKPVKLPNERTGLVMIFKTFDQVSYAITLESKRVIRNYDYLHTPKF